MRLHLWEDMYENYGSYYFDYPFLMTTFKAQTKDS